MKSAILIIDLQVGLFDEPGKPFDYEGVLSKINLLTTAARKKEMPVVFIQHETKENTLRHKSPGWNLVSGLDVDGKDYIVRKTTPNAFLRTELTEVLEKEGVNKIIVCGYATEFCVDSTVRAGASLGYHIEIVADGHTTHDKNHASAEVIRKHHNETLSNIKSFGVDIVASEASEILKSIS